jgi:hypothetical protein
MTAPTQQPPHDLPARLERAIGEPPPPGELPDPRVAGLRAVRRRRATAVVAAAAVVVAAAGGVAALTGGSNREASSVQVATDPTTSPAPVPEPPVRPAPDTVYLPSVPVPGTDPAGTSTTRLRDDHWAAYRADGTLELLPDVTVVRRIDDPIASDLTSVGLELSRPGKVDQFYVVELIEGMPGDVSTSVPVGGDYPTLESWIAHLDQPVDPMPLFPTDDLVTRAADGTLAPTEGARILDQRNGVEVSPRFSTAGDTSAALVTRNGRRFFVLVRSSYGAIDVIVTPQEQAEAVELDGFIAWARQRYASGEGLR